MSGDQNKNEKQRRGLLEMLAVKAELPSDALAGEVLVEMRGRQTMLVQGCRRILEYSPERIVIAARGFSVSVVGQRLICSAYYGGTVAVEGLISGVYYGEEGEG